MQPSRVLKSNSYQLLVKFKFIRLSYNKLSDNLEVQPPNTKKNWQTEKFEKRLKWCKKWKVYSHLVQFFCLFYFSEFVTLGNTPSARKPTPVIRGDCFDVQIISKHDSEKHKSTPLRLVYVCDTFRHIKPASAEHGWFVPRSIWNEAFWASVLGIHVVVNRQK